MDREVVLSAAVVFLLAVILFMCWVYACGRWKQRRAEEFAGHDMDIFNAEGDNQEGPARAAPRKGLNKKALEALPTFVYRSNERGALSEEEVVRGSTSSKQVECPVCLSEFQQEEIGRLLPNCSHRFHVECIDKWLLANGTCPVCRASCVADVALQVQDSSSMGVLVVQYPTNVLFWGSNSVLVSSGASLHQTNTIQVITQPLAPPPPPPPPLESAASSSSASSFSRLNPLRRLLSRERLQIGPVLYSKI